MKTIFDFVISRNFIQKIYNQARKYKNKNKKIRAD